MQSRSLSSLLISVVLTAPASRAEVDPVRVVNAASVQVQRGDLGPAAEVMRQLPDGGPVNVANAAALRDAWAVLGVLLYDLARWPDAQGAFRRAIAVTKAGLGPQHESLVGLLSSSGATSLNRGRIAEAEKTYQEARAVVSANGSVHPGAAASSLFGLAAVLAAKGQLDRSESVILEALAAVGDIPGLARERASGFNNLAALRYRRKDNAAAERYLYRAIEAAQGVPDPQDSLLLRLLLNMADLHAAQGRFKESEETLSKALAICDHRPQMDEGFRSEVLQRHASALKKVGRKDEARRTLARAKALGAVPAHAHTIDVNALAPRR
jgi:tetratricopeptide (TPR) repeat protein